MTVKNMPTIIKNNDEWVKRKLVFTVLISQFLSNLSLLLIQSNKNIMIQTLCINHRIFIQMRDMDLLLIIIYNKK